MRSASKLLAVAGTILALGTVIPSASAGTAVQTLTITKECSQYTGTIPSFCTITSSNLSQIPAGTKVFYWGPVIADPNFLSSKVVARAGHGNRAIGWCAVIQNPYHGVCTFWRGDRDALGVPRERGCHDRLGGASSIGTGPIASPEQDRVGSREPG